MDVCVRVGHAIQLFESGRQDPAFAVSETCRRALGVCFYLCKREREGDMIPPSLSQGNRSVLCLCEREKEGSKREEPSVFGSLYFYSLCVCICVYLPSSFPDYRPRLSI